MNKKLPNVIVRNGKKREHLFVDESTCLVSESLKE
jgi:hypothetical protein